MNKRSQIVIWFSLIVSIQLLLEISLISSLLVALVTTFFVWFGNVVTQRLSPTTVGFGSALIVGVIAHVCISQILLVLNFHPRIAHWAALFVLSLIGLYIRFRRTPAAWKVISDDSHEVLLALAIGTLVFALRQPWLLPFALVLALLERLWHTSFFRYPRLKLAIAVVMLSVGWLTSNLIRVDRWFYFYLGGDTGFFESIGWITSEFSIFEHPGLSGGSIAGYHWLSYTFLGSLSHVALLPPWEATTKLGPPLLLIAFAGILVHSPWNYARNKVTGATWIIVYLLTAGAAFLRYSSAGFGVIVGMVCLALVGYTYKHSTNRVARSLVLVLVVFGMIMSKATTGLVVGAVLLLLWVNLHRKGLRYSVAPITVFLFVGAFTYFSFFRSSQFTDAGRTLRLSSPISVVSGSILGTPYLVWGALVVLTALSLSKGGTSSDPIGVALLQSVVVTSILALALGFIALYQQQVMHAAFLLTTVSAAWLLLHRLGNEDLMGGLRGPRMLILWPLALMTGFALPVFYNRIDAVTEFPERLGVAGWDITKEALPFLIPWLIFIFSVRGQAAQLRTRVAAVLLVTALLITGLTLDSSRRATTWGPSVSVNWALNDSPMPSDDLREVGTWIRSNTDSATILASNEFCCFGDEWWTEIANNLEAHVSGELKWWRVLEDTPWGIALRDEYGEGIFGGALPDTRLGGDNYLLAGESRRRQLIQGLKHQAKTPTADQMNRMNLSITFANNPNASVLEGLKSYGVSGFVVNLSLTDHRDWSAFATELFRSGNYAFLSLK
jgi:hypothetical protein